MGGVLFLLVIGVIGAILFLLAFGVLMHWLGKFTDYLDDKYKK